MAASNNGPLKGVKVTDFSGFIAGCYTAQLMGDLGADVLKVEPLLGDGARYWGPFFKGESRMFQGWNRNKRSLAIDLRSDEGREIVHAIVKESDIVVENFRPGVTKRLQIDYDTVRDFNPGIIYCSISAFGAKGPYGKRPGFDPVLQSMSGTARANERYSGVVAISSVAVSDYSAGMLGTSGILAALYHREKTGEGQLIETSLLQAVMAIQNHAFCQALEAEEEPPFGIYPYRLFETKDTLIFVAAPTDKFWQILCGVLGVPELGTDPKYKTNPDRVAHGEELTELLEPHFKEKSTTEWESILVGEGVPCGPVQSYEEFFDSPQVEAMEMNPVIEHPTFGPLRVAGVPIRFSETPGSIRCTAPTLGQHTGEVLAELGYDEERIAALRTAGTIR